MLAGTLFVFYLLLNTLILLLFAVAVTLSAPLISFHFQLGKYYSYVAFSILTTVDVFHCLFWGFQTLNKYSLPCLFVNRGQKRNWHLSVISLTSKNITGTFFVVCFSIWKCINYSYVVGAYTLITPRKPYFFIYNC